MKLANKEDFFKEPSQELFHKEPVENTPFWIIGKPNGYIDKDEKIPKMEWFITWGKYRISEVKESILECHELINKKDWFLIGTWIGAIFEEMEKILKKDQ